MSDVQLLKFAVHQLVLLGHLGLFAFAIAAVIRADLRLLTSKVLDNAALLDAADKLRFLALSDGSLYGEDGELRVRISLDETARTLTVSDNGIGMTQDEVISHLGTIAKSGTKEFFSQLSGDQSKDSKLIGQFGVGFYSAFIVADKVTVRTRKAGAAANEAIEWESAGEGDYSITPISKDSRGTEIVLHLREGEDEFLNRWKVESIVTKYSDHISIPVELWQEEQPERDGADGEKLQLCPATGRRPIKLQRCGPAINLILPMKSIRSFTNIFRTTGASR